MINEYIAKNRNDEYLCERIVCKDGFSMSVQASPWHYSEGTLGNFNTVEVGYPNRREKLLAPYSERFHGHNSGIYTYVPVEVVDAIIAKHGGFA